MIKVSKIKAFGPETLRPAQSLQEPKMFEFKPSMLHRCHIEQPMPINEPAFDIHATIMQVSQKLAITSAKKVDEQTLKFLYERYRKLGATDVIVLDETEFKEFLLKYLPIYLKEKEEKENAK